MKRFFWWIISWAFLAICLVYWFLLWNQGDVDWHGTTLMFAPRWPMLIPASVLLLASAIFYRRGLLSLIPALLVVLGPIMGGNIPHNLFATTTVRGLNLRILTCNTLNGNVRQGPTSELIAETYPDVVVFQEWSRPYDVSAIFPAPVWHVNQDYGELLLASRFPILKHQELSRNVLKTKGTVARFELETPNGIINLVNVHFRSPRDGIASMIHARFAGIEVMREMIAKRDRESKVVAEWVFQLEGPTIIAGDFNLPPESHIFQRDWSSFQDAQTSTEWGWPRTWYSRWHGLAIDHVLASSDWRFRRSIMCENLGSDHRPLIADLILMDRP
jgi:vancomycin resistance protein VanJ